MVLLLIRINHRLSRVTQDIILSFVDLKKLNISASSTGYIMDHLGGEASKT
jgi:hypothetical protein